MMRIDLPSRDRYRELTRRLEDEYCVPRDVVIALDEAVSEYLADTMDDAVRHQGLVIMAAIRGELTAWPHCAPQFEVPLEDELVAS